MKRNYQAATAAFNQAKALEARGDTRGAALARGRGFALMGSKPNPRKKSAADLKAVEKTIATSENPKAAAAEVKQEAKALAEKATEVKAEVKEAKEALTEAKADAKGDTSAAATQAVAKAEAEVAAKEAEYTITKEASVKLNDAAGRGMKIAMQAPGTKKRPIVLMDVGKAKKPAQQVRVAAPAATRPANGAVQKKGGKAPANPANPDNQAEAKRIFTAAAKAQAAGKSIAGQRSKLRALGYTMRQGQMFDINNNVIATASTSTTTTTEAATAAKKGSTTMAAKKTAKKTTAAAPAKKPAAKKTAAKKGATKTFTDSKGKTKTVPAKKKTAAKAASKPAAKASTRKAPRKRPDSDYRMKTITDKNGQKRKVRVLTAAAKAGTSGAAAPKKVARGASSKAAHPAFPRGQKGGKVVQRSASTTTKKGGKEVTTTRTWKSNPMGNVGMFVTLSIGAVLGYVASDVLDRFVATMARPGAGDGKALTKTTASVAISARPDTKRMLIQGAMALLPAVVAYLLARRNKMAPATFLGGYAVGALVKFVGDTLVTRTAMPMLLPTSKAGEEPTIGDRMYYGESEESQKGLTDMLTAYDKAIAATLPAQQLVAGTNQATQAGNTTAAAHTMAGVGERARELPVRTSATRGGLLPPDSAQQSFAPSHRVGLADETRAESRPGNTLGCGGGGCGGSCGGSCGGRPMLPEFDPTSLFPGLTAAVGMVRPLPAGNGGTMTDAPVSDASSDASSNPLQRPMLTPAGLAPSGRRQQYIDSQSGASSPVPGVIGGFRVPSIGVVKPQRRISALGGHRLS